mgnify:CR=1 FL=1
MAIFDIKLPASIARALNLPVSDPRRQQIKVLKKLLRKARFTEFGQRYLFDEILLSIEKVGITSEKYEKILRLKKYLKLI